MCNPSFFILTTFLFQNNTSKTENLDIPKKKEYTKFYGLNRTNRKKLSGNSHNFIKERGLKYDKD